MNAIGRGFNDRSTSRDMLCRHALTYSHHLTGPKHISNEERQRDGHFYISDETSTCVGMKSVVYCGSHF
jgi:hypothetical protein